MQPDIIGAGWRCRYKKAKTDLEALRRALKNEVSLDPQG